jgi:aldehyde:ferredoxin oxidoreductase
MYAGITLGHWADMMSSLTGFALDGNDILKICERVFNLQRMFNVREGFKRADDKLPERVLSIPEFGTYADKPDCVTHDFDAMLDEYYIARGWDVKTGIPTKEKLAELGL